MLSAASHACLLQLVDAESSEEENNAVDHGNVQAESKEDTGQKKK